MTISATETVSSQAISEITYSPDVSSLYVEYTNGRTYVYKGVPDHIHFELLHSTSMGSYMNKNIKGKYPFDEL